MHILVENEEDTPSVVDSVIMVAENALPQSQSPRREEDEMNIESGGYPNGSVASLARTGAKPQ